MPRLKTTVASAKGVALTVASSGDKTEPHLLDSTETASIKPTKVKKGGDLPFEATLWSAADQLRGVMDASEYKHVVLGLIFLKYISDAFEEKRAQLVSDPESDSEDRDEYTATNVFWVPADARWSEIAAKAKSPQIGEAIDKAMISIEQANPSLRGVLPKEYAKPSLGSTRLGAVVDLINTIGLGTAEARQHDVIGRVYEYFLGRFANAEGKAGGEFYTPRSVVRLLVEMIEPYEGRVFDPAAGSGGMFVQSEEFVLAHGGKIGDLAIYGQESNHTTWRLAKMNLAIRGIEADIAWNRGGSFLEDAHPDLKADFILANPPFNESAWGGEGLRDDKRWAFGIPPLGNSNFAWIQHFVYHLAPTGVAAFVMSKGSMSSSQNGEADIRKALIEAQNGGLVDCMIVLPGQIFYTTQIPVCVWILARDRRNHKFRDRRGEILFIDARKMGMMIDRTHKALQNVDVSKIANAYHSWRSNQGLYDDIPGFCKSATLDEVRERRYLLTPGVYVGTETETDLADSIDERIDVLKTRYIFEQSRAADTTNRLTRTLETLGIPSLGESVSGALFDTASRLFQSWFVDFDPVRESHREQIAFLPNNLRKAFPITMIQSEAGQIPAGWHFFGLDDIATFLNGLALQKFPPVEGEPTLPVIKITQLRASDTLGADRCAASLKPDYIINNGDILFSWSGSLECEIWTGGAGALNQHLFKVYSATYPRWFVYLAILQHLGNFRRIAADKATTMGHIQRHHLHDAKIAVPSNDLLQKAGAILEPLVEIAWQKKVADKTLVSLWNSVMPKILAGNLAVSELPELFGQSA